MLNDPKIAKYANCAYLPVLRDAVTVKSGAIKTKHSDCVRNDQVVIDFDSRLDSIANNTWHARC